MAHQHVNGSKQIHGIPPDARGAANFDAGELQAGDDFDQELDASFDAQDLYSLSDAELLASIRKFDELYVWGDE